MVSHHLNYLLWRRRERSLGIILLFVLIKPILGDATRIDLRLPWPFGPIICERGTVRHG